MVEWDDRPLLSDNRVVIYFAQELFNMTIVTKVEILISLAFLNKNSLY